MENLNKSENILVISNEDDANNIKKRFEGYSNTKYVNHGEIKDIENASQSAIVLNISQENGENSFQNILKILKNGGKLIVLNAKNNVEKLEFNLKTTGFINVEPKGDDIVCFKPSYEVGSKATLNFKKVWKIDDDEEDDDDLIDPDDLLDEEDLKKPDASSLKVCGTTGKRKACADCTCGLADELRKEAQLGKVINTTDNPKSSCGSCYLGDAFRCASCPYLGMPAFKPGEKIQLVGNQLQDDI